MKRDWKLLVALLILIGLVAWLLVISLDRSKEVNSIREQINQLQTQSLQVIRGIDGKTPIIGIDYFNGSPGTNGRDGQPGKDGSNGKDGASAYDTAVKNGFIGTEQQWLDSLKGKDGLSVPELDISCIDGHVRKKYGSDSFWQLTNIKCEVDHE